MSSVKMVRVACLLAGLLLAVRGRRPPRPAARPRARDGHRPPAEARGGRADERAAHARLHQPDRGGQRARAGDQRGPRRQPARAAGRRGRRPRARDRPPRGPLHGIPVLVKDNLDVAGLPTTAGSSRSRARSRPRTPRSSRAARGRRGDPRQDEPDRVRELHDQRHAERLLEPRRPGPEPVRHRRVPVRLVLRQRRGGRGGLAAITIGTETSGSIVSPAAAQGDVGLRPTVGLVPRTASSRSARRRTPPAR